MTTLHDRLAGLADEAPAGGPTNGLWDRGRRLHRRQRLGAAVVVAATVALLAGLAGVTWSRASVDVEPAGTATELGLPDQIYAADPHLQGTDETGPIGPLVALVPTVRDSWWGSSSNGLLGISAAGEYAFLDVPRLADFPFATTESQPVVSADGRYVAYWRAGQPDGSAGNAEGDSITGVGVHDTTTGDSYRYDVRTQHGLQAATMLWVGDQLWFDVWQLDARRDDGTSASFDQQVVWDPLTDLSGVSEEGFSGLDGVSVWRDSVVRVNRSGDIMRNGPEVRESLGRLADPPDLRSPLFVSGDGARVAAQVNVEDGDSARAGAVVVAALGGADTDALTLTEVPGTSDLPVDQLVGWRDEDHLVSLDYGGGTGEARFVSLDVVSGDRTTLGYVEGNQPALAADALSGPVFDGPKPPHPLDPRLVYGGAAAVLLAAGAALLWWRRRAQR